MLDFERLLTRVLDGVERGALTQQDAAHYVGEHIARRLYCSSASLWTLSGSPGLRASPWSISARCRPLGRCAPEV